MRSPPDRARCACAALALAACAPRPNESARAPSPVPAASAASAASAGAAPDAAVPEAAPDGTPADTPSVPSAPAPPPQAAPRAEPQAPVPTKLGRRIPPGTWSFEDGLELRVTHLYGCDFDPSDPCWAGTFRAEGTLRGKRATVEWKTRSTRILGHVIEVVGHDELVVNVAH